jgi:hypothetical protein
MAISTTAFRDQIATLLADNGGGQISASDVRTVLVACADLIDQAAVELTSDYLGEAANEMAMLALVGNEGDWCWRADESRAYVIIGAPTTNPTSWRAQGVVPVAAVTSINGGPPGAVTLTKADLGLGNVDNTNDANKPVSGPQATALAGKANSSHGHAIADVTGLSTALASKSDLGHGHTSTEITNAATAISGADLTAALLSLLERHRFEWFGDGLDGDHAITTNNATVGTWLTSGVLQRDVFFNNLTINGAGQIITNGFRIFGKGRLNLDGAAAGAIQATGTNGNNATSASAAGAPTANAAGSLGASGQGGAGAAGANAQGAQAPAPTAQNPANGGAGGQGGIGGTGSGGNGNTARAGAAVTRSHIGAWLRDLVRGISLIVGGAGGAGGNGGGGNGTTAGGGGGSGGNGGRVLYISFREIERDATTAAEAIRAHGGNGGNGFATATTNGGGGGGGAGGGGGYILLAYDALFGDPATGLLSARGGNGGNGGAGNGTGTAGTGGHSGAGGVIDVINLRTQQLTQSIGPAAVAGAVPTGASATAHTVTL